MTVVDPQSVHRTSVPPPVHVEKLLVDGVEVRREKQDARALASAMPTGWERKFQISNLKLEIQGLMIIKNRAELARQCAAHPVLLDEQLREITAGATRAVEEIRATVRALRPAELDRLGFTHAIEVMVEQVQTATGLEFLTDLDPVDPLITRTAQVGLYRILQEAINNTVRHAQAKTVVLEVKENAGGIRIRCQDNGRGFDLARRPHPEGLGLAGICERAAMIGAKVHLQTAPGRGVCFLLEVPIEKQFFEVIDKSETHEA